LREWKEFVAPHARLAMNEPRELASEPVALRLLYVYEEASLDIDNILKPIQDALVGRTIR
jgi:crossover junction endodeoxyribonuclease RusA